MSLLTALYFDVLRSEDRVAIKPHASPVFHAIQYLFGRRTREKLERFRAYGGPQEQRPVARDGRIEIGSMITCTLSADHRALDGATGAEFPGEFRRLLEDPGSW